MAWFRKDPPPEPQAAPIDPMVALLSQQSALTGALLTAVTSGFKTQVESSAEIAKVFTEFTKTIGEMTVRSAARRMGSRGGRRAAENNRRRKVVENRCALCRDPHTKTVSIEMIRQHRLHEGGDDQTPEVVPVAEVPTDPTDMENVSDG